jgi:hypothetical protein
MNGNGHLSQMCPSADGCTNMVCFCREFLLKPGTYLNPFDSTRSTGIICDFSKQGWYGGMAYCDGGYFDPYTQNCTSTPQSKIPYRRASASAPQQFTCWWCAGRAGQGPASLMLPHFAYLMHACVHEPSVGVANSLGKRPPILAHVASS